MLRVIDAHRRGLAELRASVECTAPSLGRHNIAGADLDHRSRHLGSTRRVAGEHASLLHAAVHLGGRVATIRRLTILVRELVRNGMAVISDRLNVPCGEVPIELLGANCVAIRITVDGKLTVLVAIPNEVGVRL